MISELITFIFIGSSAGVAVVGHVTHISGDIQALTFDPQAPMQKMVDKSLG